MAAGDQMIRVDMTKLEVMTEPFPEEWALLGGRALSARILVNECEPSCDPLGPDNVLVLAPGVLSGTTAPTSGRMSVGAKSPLTGGIKEANAGGNPAQDLMKLGYRVIVVKGQPADPDKRYALDVDESGVSIKEVPDCKGLWNYALIDQLAKSYSATASFISIGPAGELKLKGASVACTEPDAERHPSHHAGRGGLGAVMGSKGLKYVAVDSGKLPARTAADKKAFMALCKKKSKEYLAGPLMMKWGTAASVPMANMLNTFPYKNRVEGQSPDVETLDGARIVESFEERGGGMHNCMTGCIVQCSNIVNDADGNYKTSSLEFETLTLLGANCAIQNWEDVADLDRLCDEIGLDTIETGAAIGILMDSGGMEWGDAEGAKRLLQEISDGTELGRLIGNGALATGKKRGHHRIPTVKGQAIPAWDPRPLKATGITYLTSAQGADHTAGLVVAPGMAVEDMARASQENQLINALVDSSGFCMFLSCSMDEIKDLYGAMSGSEFSRQDALDMAWQCMQDEWAFNRGAGFDADDDVMPSCMQEDAIGPGKEVFDVPADVVAQAYQLFEPRDEFWTKSGAG
ncbi:MAG: aldehyde ferredoxin oxidoreductase [Deltaproteobacteria bacterium]|nr:aldehyde ferredoxin oxidoreductase [Deltaproteobacteria bacterium]MBW2360574.1 aldehyde ferredoxin oxidoreductase [Deltaproteobacteria bacterium]